MSRWLTAASSYVQRLGCSPKSPAQVQQSAPQAEATPTLKREDTRKLNRAATKTNFRQSITSGNMVAVTSVTSITTGIRLAGDASLQQYTSFCSALSLWELVERYDGGVEGTARHSSWNMDAALLFVDISGFTNLCTKLDVDCLQGHINKYFSMLIEVVVRSRGDVLNFAGDAVLCAWCVEEGSDTARVRGALRLRARAHCRRRPCQV
mmetsp:Transcript_42376/g.105500  ORF Transcript_42376/g.105500 Transcript_42376/m.105500 type:complete len:208 (-) Transcript_42376:762-1385(-)